MLKLRETHRLVTYCLFGQKVITQNEILAHIVIIVETMANKML